MSRRAFLLAKALSLVVGCWAGAAHADEPSADDEAVTAWDPELERPSLPGERLYLAVRLNAQDRGVFEFRKNGSALSASDDTLRQIGLVMPPSASTRARALTDVAGLATHLDEALQRLDLDADPELLPASPVVVNQAHVPVISAATATGIVLNYDVYAGTGGGMTDASGLFALRAFTGRTVLETTGLARATRAGSRQEAQAIRLDTTVSRVWPEQRLRLTAGDLVTGAVGWSRPTRLAGLQIGTDFSLQPYLSTVPTPTFMGSAALPSKVELFVDGVKQWDGDVAAGRFTVGAGPSRVDGMGRAELVMTDILGRVSTQRFTFYETPRLLRKGLIEWSAAAGAVRRYYGERSFAYGAEPVISGSWRRGMTERLTLETHGEASARSALAGLGVAWLQGPLGEFSGSLSVSSGNTSGRQWTLGYAMRARNVGVSAELRRASRGFADIASDRSVGPPLAVDNVQVSYSSRRVGAVGLGYVRLQPANGPRSSFAMFNWSRPLARTLTVNTSLRQNVDRRADRSVFVSVSLTPGANRQVSIGLQSQQRGQSYTASVQQNASLEGGVGWRADVAGIGGRWQGQGQINWLTDYGEAQARITAARGSRTVHAGFSGSVAVLDGAVFPSRRIDDGFAVVSTGEASGIPVLVHNRPVGKSGKDGRLLVTQLRAFEQSMISIDAAAVDPDFTISSISAVAVPSDRSGVRVTFPVRRIRSARATITDAAGRAIAVGTLAKVEGMDEPVTIGFDGLFYLEDPPSAARVTVSLAPGSCTFRLPATDLTVPHARLGAIVCERAP